VASLFFSTETASFILYYTDEGFCPNKQTSKHMEINKPSKCLITKLKIYSHRPSDWLISILFFFHRGQHIVTFPYWTFDLQIVSFTNWTYVHTILQIVSFTYWTFIHTKPSLQIVPFAYWTSVQTELQIVILL